MIRRTPYRSPAKIFSMLIIGPLQVEVNKYDCSTMYHTQRTHLAGSLEPLCHSGLMSTDDMAPLQT
jgi:hypothetical protein